MPLTSNGPDPTSLRGHTFDPNDATTLPSWFVRQSRKWTDERKQQEAGFLTERYRIVETCPECGRGLIEEEHLAHKMNHVPSAERALVRTLMSTAKETRLSILDRVRDLTEEGF